MKPEKNNRQVSMTSENNILSPSGSVAISSFQPLATRMRPSSIDQFVGQTHMLAPGKPLRRAIEQGILHSMILWGPPGTGKTTLAQLMANTTQARFERLSAISAGVKDLRKVVEDANAARLTQQQSTILFIDEIHRFNKAQQDVFLPYVEDGTFIFVGATTENPSFELNSALLSRARVYVLKRLTEDELLQVLHNALTNIDRGLGKLAINISIRVAINISSCSRWRCKASLKPTRNYL